MLAGGPAVGDDGKMSLSSRLQATRIPPLIKFDHDLVPGLVVGSEDCLTVDIYAPADETTPLDHAGGQIPCSYVHSKRAGVDEVRQGVKKGLNA